MSKKSLLNESTVRRFMKYANIGHLSENFIGEGDRYEEEEELDMGPPDAAGPDMGDMGDEVPMGDDAPMDDLGGEEEVGAEVEVSEEEALALVDAIASAVADVTGHAVSASADEEAPEAELSGDEGPEAGPPVEEPPAEEDPEGDEVLEGVDMIDEDEVVNETIRRVTRRIKNMQKRDRLAETVTNRIMKRLRKNK
tara:strand:+ start:736 stop:1323 length:588 start_codon:yes stop_codon:yes gene_type:complete